ncbi:SusC/RagA family TonB-linked outer membrane protein [Rhizosphaericola mali]|uniref:SusC/RagA family TonB-linked outer membrane protein n=1 Tax=Rhizosphaericola mali TaxID=2545455 RepID=A0A5P2G7L5_9BACT|nr:SusC/RagA family TonB-linked outer membrane protein [Rhizosphaericola mali]QES89760.1 SusC/RagA family TonB-linked outer membrane protein [Rhizosphaericola mali]
MKLKKKKRTKDVAKVLMVLSGLFAMADAQNVIDSTKDSKTDTSKNLQEVVVTAMGIKRLDRNIGYSVQSVRGADLVKARDADAISGLTGKVAGLSIGTSAEMLGSPQVVLRGNKDIMYVVDGIPVNSDGWNLSPDDIESYTVLKGPNAAALYGFRGQNGAIVITTKKGTRDPRGWKVSLNSSNVLETGFLALPKPQTEYGRGSNYLYQYAVGGSYTYGNSGTDALYDNTQRLAIWGPRFDGQMVKQYDSPYDPTTGVRTPTAYVSRGKDNFKNFMENGFLSTNNVAASTSGDNYDMRMSYSHTYQKGMAPNTKLNIDNLMIAGDYRFDDHWSMDASLNLNIQYSPNIPDVSYGPNSFVYELAVYGPADYDVRDLKNVWGGAQGAKDVMQYSENYGRSNNPYFQSQYWLRSHYKTDIYGYLRLKYRVNDDLDVSIRSQVSTWNQTRDEKVPISAVLNDYLPKGWYTFGQYNGDFREDKRTSLENNTDLLLNYNKQISSDWHLNALAGASMRSFKYNSTWATTRDLSIPWVYTLQNSKGAGYNYSFNSNMMVWSGYYSFDAVYKKYFSLTTTGRVDNLSTFAKGNRTFFYPSVSLSSVITDYLKLPDFISYLKLRASYANVKSGLTQATVPSAYYMATGKTTNAGLLGYGDELYSSYNGPSYSNQMGYATTTYYNNTVSPSYSTIISNSSLKPASNTSYEGGADIHLFHNRLNFSGTYFISDAGPQIYSLAVAPSTGYAGRNVNGITTRKKGWELMLDGTPIKNPNGLTWDVAINWSTYKEKLKDIYGDETGLTLNGHTYRVGERMDAYYGTGFVRNQAGQIIYSSGLPMQNPSSSLEDKKFLGFMNPSFSFGINNTFSYKSFSFSFQFDGRIGGKIFDRVYDQMTNGGTSQESVTGTLGTARLKEWQSTNGGTLAPTPAYVGDGVVITSGTPIYSKGVITNSDQLTFSPNTTAVSVQSFLSNGVSGGNIIDEYFMISRSYAKLRQVIFTYTLPNSLLKNGFIKGATVSVIGRNLLYFAARKDFDIDQYASGYNFSDNSLSGTESTGLQSPTARRYGININLNF